MTQPEGMDSVPFDMNEVLDNLAIENGRLRVQLRVAQARINTLLAHITAQEASVPETGNDDSAHPVAEPTARAKVRKEEG